MCTELAQPQNIAAIIALALLLMFIVALGSAAIAVQVYIAHMRICTHAIMQKQLSNGL